MKHGCTGTIPGARSASSPWYGRNGDLKGIVGISSDVTKLVKTEIKARETARILEERNKSLEKEIDLAREIQFALLPYELPPVPARNAE